MRRAAARIFVHVSNEAVNVFPVWARWSDAEAFQRYLAGLEHRRKGEFQKARDILTEVSQQEPNNMIVRLQLANLSERQAGEETSGVVNEARALAAYLKVAVERPELVEARFRASVLASNLAVEYPHLSPALQGAVGRLLQLEAANGTVADLESLSQRETDAVVQLLQPWYPLLRKGRLRSQYEPRGQERRELKRAVAITRHCVGLRLLPGEDTRSIRAQVLWRRFVVRFWHNLVLRPSSGWQAHYNTACFYALLAQRESRLANPNG